MIRIAQKDDSSAMAPILLQAMPEIIAQYIGSDDPTVGSKALEAMMQMEDSLYSYRNCMVYVADGVISGVLCAYRGDDFLSMQSRVLDFLQTNYGTTPRVEQEAQVGEYYIDGLSVLPTMQGKGIGRMLLEFALEEATKKSKDQGLDRISLLVLPEKANAIALYSKLGFVKAEEFVLLGEAYDRMSFPLH